MSERMWVENIVVTPCSLERDLISSRNSCRPIGFQSRSRLVEKQQSWLVEKGLRQCDLSKMSRSQLNYGRLARRRTIYCSREKGPKRTRKPLPR
jgi:hypothetical protein